MAPKLLPPLLHSDNEIVNGLHPLVTSALKQAEGWAKALRLNREKAM
jgi:hypothetical protein